MDDIRTSWAAAVNRRRRCAIPPTSGWAAMPPWPCPSHKIPKSAVSTEITGHGAIAQSGRLNGCAPWARAYDGTLNDAVMAMCRRPAQTPAGTTRLAQNLLKAMAPVSVRAAGDMDSANAVGMVIADLATNVRDPAKRFRTIKDSMDAARRNCSNCPPVKYRPIPRSARPLLLTQLTGLASRFPAFSTVISNVPGPREKRYWNGARLDGMYPVSIPMDGSAVNFTLVSNNENLDFGSRLPQIGASPAAADRLYGGVLVELEDAAIAPAQASGQKCRKARRGSETTGKARSDALPQNSVPPSRGAARIIPGGCTVVRNRQLLLTITLLLYGCADCMEEAQEVLKVAPGGTENTWSSSSWWSTGRGRVRRIPGNLTRCAATAAPASSSSGAIWRK